MHIPVPDFLPQPNLETVLRQGTHLAHCCRPPGNGCCSAVVPGIWPCETSLPLSASSLPKACTCRQQVAQSPSTQPLCSKPYAAHSPGAVL